METKLKNLRDYCSCLKILLTNDSSSTKNEEKAEKRSLGVESDLLKCMKNTIESIKNYPVVNEHLDSWALFLKDESFIESSVIWSFVLWCCVMLLGIRKELDTIDVIELSIGDQKTIVKAVQFLVRLEIYPNLIPGVGNFVEKRSEFSLDVAKESVSFYNSYRRLLFSLIILLTIANHPALKTIVLTNHLVDLIVGLGQICHAPIKKYRKEPPKLDMKILEEQKIIVHDVLKNHTEDNFKKLIYFYKDGYNGSEFELIQEMCSDRQEFEPIFDKLVVSVYQPLLVRDLLHLQKFSGASKIKWLKKLCGHQLSSALLRRNGVMAILEAILPNLSGTGESASSDYVKYDKICKLISQSPVQCESIENYYSKICPQIINLLLDEKYPLDSAVSKISCNILNNMFDGNFVQCFKYSIKPITKNLMKAIDTDSKKDKVSSDILIKEKELENCVILFTKLFSSNLETNESLMKKVLLQFFHFFFKLYVYINNGSSHLRSLVKNIILFLLNNSDDCIKLLYYVSFDEFHGLENVLHVRDDIQFCYGEAGGVIVKKIECSSDGDKLEELELKVTAICDLLYDLSDKENIIADWFLVLLDRLSSTLDKDETRSEKEIYNDLVLVSLIKNLSELEDLNFLKNPNKVIAFVKTTLKRLIQLKIEANRVNSECLLGDESSFLIVSIVMILVNHKDEISPHDWLELKNSSKQLVDLESIYKEHFLGSFISGVRKLIEVSEDKNIANNDATDENIVLSPFFCAWKELEDPLIPTKGSSLIKIKNLILEKDEEALGNKEMLFSVIQEHLDHEDSYIYLTAIEALSSLALVYTDDILPSMASRFANFNKGNDSLEYRVKLGEALVKICKNLGDMVPKYRINLLNSFLASCKHEDPLIRASSLSNLGEICKILKFSLGGFKQEILMCVTSFSNDENVEVRRAAVMVLTLLLRGLGQNSFEVLEQEMLPVYRHLKKVYEIETDDVVKLHVEQALEELNVAVKDLLTPSQSITKEIRVLDPF